MMLMSNIHFEVLFVGGYAVFLLTLSMGIELLAWFSHHRLHSFKTVGFQYHKHINAWQCSEGHYLWLHEVDHEKRLARYRAKPNICNCCAIKHKCTDSEDGREIMHSLDPWPHSEIGHFQRGISLTLVVLAGFILGIELLRHHRQIELFILGASFLLVLIVGVRIFATFRVSRVHFPLHENVSFPPASQYRR